MREAGNLNQGMRVISGAIFTGDMSEFKPCKPSVLANYWVREASFTRNIAGAYLCPQTEQGLYSSSFPLIGLGSVYEQGAFSPGVFLKPPTYYTLSYSAPLAPGLQQISLLERQVVGRLTETPTAYIFTKSSTAVNTAEGVLKDLLKLLKTQAESLKNSNDLAVRVYRGDDVAYPVEGGISYVRHEDFAFIKLHSSDEFSAKPPISQAFTPGDLNSRVLY